MEMIHEFIQLLQKMQWQDYVDILVVSFLIYKLLPLIRTPNVMRITRTVIALVLIAWLTDVMKLHTLNWILSQLLAIGLLAFVVLFQPELRKMLDHLGNVKLGQFFGFTRPVQDTDNLIIQIVMACESMSRGKIIETKKENGMIQTHTEYTGALIVIAREQRLEEYIKTGTTVDAQVSSQLLRNIFFKNSPLHDGAVIIRDNRLVAAGCVLPLSSRELDKDLGTRHKAGLGMSEESDAVVIVVSEEKGTISLAVGGMRKRMSSPMELEQHLRKELGVEMDTGADDSPAVQVLRKIGKKGGHYDEK